MTTPGDQLIVDCIQSGDYFAANTCNTPRLLRVLDTSRHDARVLLEDSRTEAVEWWPIGKMRQAKLKLIKRDGGTCGD